MTRLYIHVATLTVLRLTANRHILICSLFRAPFQKFAENLFDSWTVTQLRAKRGQEEEGKVKIQAQQRHKEKEIA